MKQFVFLVAVGAASLVGIRAGGAEQRRKPEAVVGGREITSTAELYSAVPGVAKRSELVGGMVKTFSGEVDLICAQASKICVITFKEKK
ncbi:MAG: hypothetical protein ABL958_16525 [Bdellovibrionia bacterium]